MPQLSKRAELEILEQERSKNASTIVSTAAYLVFAPCAAAVAALPGFLFTTGMFGVEFEANIALYVAVTAVTRGLSLRGSMLSLTTPSSFMWPGRSANVAEGRNANFACHFQ